MCLNTSARLERHSQPLETEFVIFSSRCTNHHFITSQFLFNPRGRELSIILLFPYQLDSKKKSNDDHTRSFRPSLRRRAVRSAWTFAGPDRESAMHNRD